MLNKFKRSKLKLCRSFPSPPPSFQLYEQTSINKKKKFNRFFKTIQLKLIKLTLNTSHVAENGRTAIPTNRSATAKLTIKKFVTLRNLCEQKTAAITKQLPTITSMSINIKIANDIKLAGFVHSTDACKALHCDSFMAL